MKKTLLTLVFLFILVPGIYCQINTKLTQFFQTPHFYNPALTGIEPFVDIKLGRKQNLGAYDFAPRSSFLSINTAYNASKVRKAQSYSLRISNPRIYEELHNPSFYLLKHGVGAYFINEKQNAFTQNRLQIAYSAHFALKGSLRFAAAISPFFFNNRADLNDIDFEVNPDPAYGQFNRVSYSRLGANAGLVFYDKDFYGGYSALNVLKSKLSTDEQIAGDSTVIKEKITHQIMGGYRIDLRERLDFIPALLVSVTPNRPVLFNVNAKFRYDKKYWAGLSYQTSGTLSLATGGIINNWLNIGYSYDHTFRGISNYVSGSHEIVVGIMLFHNNLNKPYFW